MCMKFHTRDMVFNVSPRDTMCKQPIRATKLLASSDGFKPTTWGLEQLQTGMQDHQRIQKVGFYNSACYGLQGTAKHLRISVTDHVHLINHAFMVTTSECLSKPHGKFPRKLNFKAVDSPCDHDTHYYPLKTAMKLRHMFVTVGPVDHNGMQA